MSRKKINVIAVTPLDPPATEAEKNEASRVWTAAMDVMESRGFGRYLWGNTSEAAHDFVILMLRAARSGNGMPHDEAGARCEAVTGNREGQVPTSAAAEQSEPRPEAAPGGDDGAVSYTPEKILREFQKLIEIAPGHVALVIRHGDRVLIRDNSGITGLVSDALMEKCISLLSHLFPAQPQAL